MYKTTKAFIYNGINYSKGQEVSEELAVVLGSHVEYVFSKEGVTVKEAPQKPIKEKKVRKYTPKDIGAVNKAVLKSKNNK